MIARGGFHYISRAKLFSLIRRPGLVMRIAKPLLLISTPIGVIAGLREAWRFHAWLAVLMAVLLTVVGVFIAMTVRVARREGRANRSP